MSVVHVRRAYVLSYNYALQVPKWVAWHVIPDYRDTPERTSIWKSFRTDPEISAVKDGDYVGWYDSEENFARGHIAPYFISGGDRDNDGKDAEIESTLKIEDEYDACTVYEVNAMSNIAPQYHTRFNGSPGEWYTLESAVRKMVDKGKEFHVFAGTVFMEGRAVQKIGNRDQEATEWKIGVPHGFFKIVVDSDNNEAVGFLFDHQQNLENGCNIDSITSYTDCIVSIEEIEQVTNLKFFSLLDTNRNNLLIETSTLSTWNKWLDN